MKLLFLYGPPAAGKLTVAREIEKLTGFTVFQNHLVVDLAKALFEYESPQFYDLCAQLRLSTFETAARNKLAGLVFPFCYSHPQDDPFVNKIEEVIQRYAGEVLFTFLNPTRAALERRIVYKSRRALGKISTIKELRTFLSRWSFEPVTKRESFVVDNSRLPPKVAAAQIVEHFKLDVVGQRAR